MAGSTADAAAKRATLHAAGVLAGILAGPFFLVSVGLNTWASLGYLHQLGWEFVGGEQVPWPSSLARGPYGWVQIATFLITGALILVLAVALRDQLPHRRASGFAVVLLGLLGASLMLAAFRVDVPMVSGGNPNTWHGWGARNRVSVDHCDGRARTVDDGPRGAEGCELATTGRRFGGGQCALRRLPALAVG